MPATIVPSGVNEESDEPDPRVLVGELALRKAVSVAADYQSAIVLGADTTVAIDDVQLGKPESADDARQMLSLLSGRTHTVHTGIALVEMESGRQAVAVESTDVTFASLTAREISSYVATGSPFDKAGAYGIQDDLGALLVERIDGCYYNVVGLPLRRFYETLVRTFPDRLTLADDEG